MASFNQVPLMTKITIKSVFYELQDKKKNYITLH